MIWVYSENCARAGQRYWPRDCDDEESLRESCDVIGYNVVAAEELIRNHNPETSTLFEDRVVETLKEALR
jgi:hypothetical protein